MTPGPANAGSANAGPLVGRWGLSSRIVALSLALLLLVQGAVFSVVRISIEQSARSQIAQELQVGERVWRRLLRQLMDKKLYDEAKKVGEGALYVDIHGGETHALYAEALLGAKDADGAIFEGETALLTDKLTADIASRALVTISKAYLGKGNKQKATEARDEAVRQDPENAEAKALVIP